MALKAFTRNTEKGTVDMPHINIVDPPKSDIYEITPELAADWLSRAGKNRRLSNRIVLRYAEAMQRGEWAVTGETIKFSTTVELIDGQHRLSAVVMSGVTIRSYVVFGVDPVAFDVMDSGKGRSPSDVLSLHGFANSTLLASTVALVLTFLRHGDFNVGTGQRVRPSKPEILAFVQANPGVQESLKHKSGAGGVRFLSTPPALLSALHYLLYEVDPEDCSAFFASLGSGAGLSDDDPIFQLRKRLIDNAQSIRKLRTNDIGALVIKAWNAYREGRKVKLLSYKSGGATPEQFPVIF